MDDRAPLTEPTHTEPTHSEPTHSEPTHTDLPSAAHTHATHPHATHPNAATAAPPSAAPPSAAPSSADPNAPPRAHEARAHEARGAHEARAAGRAPPAGWRRRTALGAHAVAELLDARGAGKLRQYRVCWVGFSSTRSQTWELASEIDALDGFQPALQRFAERAGGTGPKRAP